MSEAVISLVSGIVGALIGGAASLAGTMLVGRMHFVRGARVKIFQEILPRITERTLPSFINDQRSAERFEEYVASIGELAREAQVAGRPERSAMRKVFLLNTGSESTLSHGTFEIKKEVVAANHAGIADALLELGFAVSHRIR